MKIIKNLLFMAALAVISIVPRGTKAEAATISATISSTDTVAALYLYPRESLSYSVTGISTGTLIIEFSRNGRDYELTPVSIVGAGSVSSSGTLYSGAAALYFKFRASTITAGAFVATMSDNDDLVSRVSNNKDVKIVDFYDDSMRVYGQVQAQTIEVTGGFSDSFGFGDSLTAVSTLTTSGNSTGQYATFYLAGTSAVLEGSVVLATTPVAGQGAAVVLAPAVADQTGWIGVARAAASTGSLVDVYYSGFVLARTSGTVTPGQTLVTGTSAAGYLIADTTPTTGADQAVALANGTAAGGLTRVRLR